MGKITRGISKEFAEEFLKCDLNKLYHKHKKEIFIGVRNNYLNLYYNSDSIAKVELVKKKISCKIDKYYLSGKHIKGKNKIKKIEPSDILNSYETIKENSNGKASDEKKAQSRLVLMNNHNADSKWYCIDVEWVKAFKNKQAKDDAKFNGRFDIIAIAKKKPHIVALIELKYGSGAIGGESGIKKHIDDFKKYQDNSYFNKQEVCDIIESQKMLGVDIPDELVDLRAEDIGGYEFYVITLNNNAEIENGSTPKQTMSGYLFNDKRWDCKKLSSDIAHSTLGDVTNKENPIRVKFLFSTQTLDNLNIKDIIEDGNYERE